MQTSTSQLGERLDLSNCDKEPIHIPGAIQPHGVLFRLEEPGFTITHVSTSCEALLHLAPRELIGRPIQSLLDSEQAESFCAKLSQPELAKHNPHKIVIRDGQGALRDFDGIAHRYNGNLILELEPGLKRAGVAFADFYHQARESVQRLRASRTLKELLGACVAEVKKISGFDRVIVYRFDECWSGHVIAEERAEHVISYLDLHFPASDIPAQARALYRLNSLRLIPTVDYEPSRLVSQTHEIVPHDVLDLSMSVLRSVSPIHLEYLHNMGVTASMSVSLVKDGRLWGLISCTHESGPLYVPYDARAVCDFIGEIMSSLLPEREKEEDASYRMRLLEIQSGLLQKMTQADDFIEGLTRDPAAFLELGNAIGAAVYYANKSILMGDAPSDEAMQKILAWLSEQGVDGVVCETSLPALMPEFAAFKDKACGILAFSISKTKANHFIWFRPEVIQTVSWGGNPQKQINQTDAAGFLHPRKSFDLWREQVRLKCLPWKKEEQIAVANLRSSIIDIVLQRLEKVAKLNAELERSNSELDSFAYAASHDLKEPLRGIYNYVNLVLRDDGHLLPEDSRNRMHTVSRLAQRMEDLINSLLHYAQIGRADILMRKTDLNEIAKQALEALKGRLDEDHAVVDIPRPLPTVICDRVQMLEVFTNLISNAVKYNDKPDKRVVIDSLPNPEPAFSPIIRIKDNGIGIAASHYDTVFKIFKRLHPKTRYGGGTGTGLTITKKIIEGHGGKMWIESEIGAGSSFLFTIAQGYKNAD